MFSFTPTQTLKRQSSPLTIHYSGQVGKQHQTLPAAHKIHDCPITIKQKIAEKSRLRRDWHRLRTPESKRLLNTAAQDFKQLLNRNNNDCIQTFLQGFKQTKSTDYSLWKVTKKIKRVTQPSTPLRTLTT
jgi:hypothetical protein